MDKQAAERAQASATTTTGAGEDSNDEIKLEPMSPMSPQQTTDEASLMITLDKNKESLKRKLMMRRSLNELVDQGIYPSPKTPIAFMEQKKSLERAKIGDSLRFKISHRPDRQQLVQQHILEDTTIDPSLHERQRLLKKARLADSLNDKLQHRPGVLELIQGNIIQTDGKLHQLIKEGSLSFDKSSDVQYMNEDSKSSDEASSPDQTDDSNLSDISSPPVIPPAPELPISFAKALPLGTHIQFHQDSKVTFPQPTLPSSIPQPVVNTGGISLPTGAFTAASFTPRNNTVPTYNITSSKSRPKKSKPKATPKAKVIKFHEYKGPPNIVKSTQPVSSTAVINAAVTGLGTGNNSLAQVSALAAAQNAAKQQQQQNGETPYHILLQQQQLFLQWQLEFSQKNPNATALLVQKDGQPAVLTSSGAVSSSIVGSESTPLSVLTQASPQTVFTVTPSSQQSQVQQLRISSPVMTQVKQEPPVGQPQPQMNPNVTPVTTNKANKKSTTVTTGQPKQYTSLEEMKVPELKAELKKRNLTVSGAKDKLIERLKPYADSVLKPQKDKSPSSSSSVTSPSSSIFSPTGSLISGMSPPPFTIVSPPNSAASPQQGLRLSNGVVISAPASMTLPVMMSSNSATFSQPGSVQSTFSSLQSPGSVNSTVTPVTSPSASNSVFSQPGSVGSVIEEIMCSNAESPLPSIQSMQSAVSVSNMTMIPDDLSNPFSPPESPLVMENVMTPLSPDDMDIPVLSPNNGTTHHTLNGPQQMEQSRPPSVVSVVPSEVDKLDMAMDIDLDLNQSLSCSLAPALNAVTLGQQMSQATDQMLITQAQPPVINMQTEMFKPQQDDPQQMLNHIQAQLRILQEKQQQKQQQQQQAASSSAYQLSQEELLRQQQEKIEKLQAQLQESQLQLQLQQLQHQQFQQQQMYQQQQQQQIQVQQPSQPGQPAQQKVTGMPQVSAANLQAQVAQNAAVQQPLHGQPEVQQPALGQPAIQVPQVQVNVQQSQTHVNSQTPRQITVQVPRSSPSIPAPASTPNQMPAQPTAVPGQKAPAAKPQSNKPNQAPGTQQVIFSVPNGVKPPTLGNLPANMKQIQIPASWLTNIQSTPQGMSAVIVPQGKKTKAPNLEFIKNQTINQTLNLVGGKSLIAVSTGTGGQQQLIIAAAPQSKPSTVPSSTATTPSPHPPAPPAPVNGLTKQPVQPTQHNMINSLPASPVEQANQQQQQQQRSNVAHTSSSPFYIPMKEPPKYDEAVRNKQAKTPEAGSGEPVEKSQTMDDVLEILIRTGELPASAAEEPPPTPKTTTQSPTVPTMSVSQSNLMSPPTMTFHNQSVLPSTHGTMTTRVGQDTEMKGNIDSVYIPYEDMVTTTSSSHMPYIKTEVKSEPCDGQMSICPPAVDNSVSNDLFDFNDVINSGLNSMDWTHDHTFGDLDLNDTSGISTGMDLMPTDQSLLNIPSVQSPARSNHGSEPDLTNLGLGDMETNSNMQIDTPDWLDVIMPHTGFTPVSANAPVSFPADPILTPQTQKDVLDLFNFDESDLNTPSDLNCGSAWDKLTETTSG